MSKKTVLFAGDVGEQSVSVGLEWRDGDLVVSSHAMGPGVVPYFGEDEIEAFVSVKAAQLPKLARALGCSPTPASIRTAMVNRFRGDSAAESHFGAFLREHRIRHEYFVI